MGCHHLDPLTGEEKLMLDTTGAFHWCPNQTLEKCTLDDEQVVKNNFTLSHLEFLSVTIDGVRASRKQELHIESS